MKKIIETDRLIMRAFEEKDAEAVLEFGSHPDVIKYTGDKAISKINEAHDLIKNVWFSDYEKYGYGRFAVVYKPENKVIGFSGLKNDTQLGFTDIGYRFLPEYWGKGIATESCIPFLKWGFEELKIEQILGLAYPENGASCHILQKIGLKHFKTEPFPGEEKKCNWYRMRKEDYIM